MAIYYVDGTVPADDVGILEKLSTMNSPGCIALNEQRPQSADGTPISQETGMT